MHPLRKLRESGKATPAQVSELLAENSLRARSWCGRSGRDVIAAIFAQSSSRRRFRYLYSRVQARQAPPSCAEGTMDGHSDREPEVTWTTSKADVGTIALRRIRR
jgi:hypothetical protein